MCCKECDQPIAYKKKQLCRKHYMQEYDKARPVSFDEWDKEHYWQFVKQQLKLN